jgi:hypothetical protein
MRVEGIRRKGWGRDEGGEGGGGVRAEPHLLPVRHMCANISSYNSRTR